MLIEPRENVLKCKTRERVRVICSYCNKEFMRKKHELFKHSINESTVDALYKNHYYCNRKCQRLSCMQGGYFCCKQCGKGNIYRPKNELNKNIFCSLSCAATYNNTHKTKGTRVSKLELWLQSELVKLYPNLIFEFNSKTAINSELDIYIPSLKLAFELNGIFHYEPIYGTEKLKSIQNNDNRKFQACLELGIELCIIDSSRLKIFNPKQSKKFLDICINIIDSKLL